MIVQAFVIKKQITHEHDQLVTLYTKELGRVEAIAKSIMKQNSIQAMHVNVGNLIKCDLIEGRSMPIITGAHAEEVYYGIKSDLFKMSLAGYIMEAIDKMVFPRQSDGEVWEFMEDSFAKLNNIQKLSADKKVLTEIGSSLLSVMGYNPNIEQCAFCSSRGEFVAFSPEIMGIICGNCFLSGRRGVLIGHGENPVQASLQAIFESLVGASFNSLTFARTVIQLLNKTNAGS